MPRMRPEGPSGSNQVKAERWDRLTGGEKVFEGEKNIYTKSLWHVERVSNCLMRLECDSHGEKWWWERKREMR